MHKNNNDYRIKHHLIYEAVSGSLREQDGYVSGIENNQSDTNPVAKYWKNGIPVMLGGGITFSTTAGIAVAGSDVYVAGMEGFYAKYWKNGVAVDLSNGSTFDRATGIFLK